MLYVEISIYRYHLGQIFWKNSLDFVSAQFFKIVVCWLFILYSMKKFKYYTKLQIISIYIPPVFTSRKSSKKFTTATVIISLALVYAQKSQVHCLLEYSLILTLQS